MKSHRKLKVSKLMVVHSKYGKINKAVPHIRLTGNWLANAGFISGEFVRVIVADNFLHIIKNTAPDGSNAA